MFALDSSSNKLKLPGSSHQQRSGDKSDPFWVIRIESPRNGEGFGTNPLPFSMVPIIDFSSFLPFALLTLAEQSRPPATQRIASRAREASRARSWAPSRPSSTTTTLPRRQSAPTRAKREGRRASGGLETKRGEGKKTKGEKKLC